MIVEENREDEEDDAKNSPETGLEANDFTNKMLKLKEKLRFRIEEIILAN